MTLILSLFISLAALNSTVALAAPIPLTSTSALISRNEGLYRSPLGFSIHASETGWKQLPPPNKNEYIVTMYENRSTSTPSALTVRVDELKRPTPLEEYSKKWLRDYPRFGFDVITAKKVRVGDNVGYMLDLLSRENKKQLRQLLFVKDKRAVTLTCRGDRDKFKTTVRDCNEIIRTFRWN